MKQSILFIILILVSGSFFYEKRSEWLKDSESRWLTNYPIASTGPFRGLLVSSWWVEIQKLQRRYDYAKIGRISRRICYLQPNIPEVWDYMCWNLYYNLLAETNHDREEQLFWLREGVSLMKDGLKYNPHKGKLYFFYGMAIYQKYKGDFDLKDELWELLNGDPIEEAYLCFKKSLEEQPEDIFVEPVKYFNFQRHDMLIQLSIETKRFNEAIQHLKDLESLYPTRIDRINQLRNHLERVRTK